MEIKEVEHDTIREISKSAIVDDQSFPSIYQLHETVSVKAPLAKDNNHRAGTYLDIIQVLLFNCLKVGNLGIYPG